MGTRAPHILTCVLLCAVPWADATCLGSYLYAAPVLVCKCSAPTLTACCAVSAGKVAGEVHAKGCVVHDWRL